MKAVLTPRAERDVYAIVERIAQQDVETALEWGQHMLDRAEAVARMPRRGRVVPEFGRTDVREVFVRTYRIVYRVERTMTFIVTIFDGRRQMPSDLDPDEP